jgi:hypothetical protein
VDWAAQELKYADLGDVRRNRRLIKIVEDLSQQPNESVPQAARDLAAVQGVYEFWGNRRIKSSAIIGAHASSTVERIEQHQAVLTLQDTTELDYSEHKSKRGIGPLSNPAAKGLKVHTVLSASTEGVPLGVLAQKVWAREKRNRTAKVSRQAIQQKESQRWLESLEKTHSLIPQRTQVITVADREADIYELFAQSRPENSEFLIRAAQNRNTKLNAFDEEIVPLFEAIRQTPSCGKFSLELQRTPRRVARSATLSVRVTKLWLQPPAHLASLSLPQIEVNVILAQEENPPSGEKAISWLLLTTLEVADFERACECLKWYSYRWLIERYHYALKSGCQIEKLQLETGDRIERALATYAIVAWRLLWLTYQARQNPEQTVEGILQPHEWQGLYCRIHKTNKPPTQVPTLGECVRWIAQLGGFLGRKGDGDPGVKTLWRGLQRLHDIADTWLLVNDS